jgi:hypothetical protein
MTAPKPKAPFDALVVTGTYSAEERLAIQMEVAKLRGIEVNAALDELQYLASYYSAVSRLAKMPTPKQQIPRVQKLLAALEMTRTALEDTYLGCEALPGEEAYRVTLTDFIFELQQHRAKLMAIGNSGRLNAAQTHTDYWNKLAQWWNRRAGTPVQQRLYSPSLKDFLMACSAPIFPKETTIQAIASFIKRR